MGGDIHPMNRGEYGPRFTLAIVCNLFGYGRRESGVRFYIFVLMGPYPQSLHFPGYRHDSKCALAVFSRCDHLFLGHILGFV